MGDHKTHIGHVGETIHTCGEDHMRPIPYKVWGNHKSHRRHEDTSHMGDHMYIWGNHTITVPYKVRRDHKIPIPYRYGEP